MTKLAVWLIFVFQIMVEIMASPPPRSSPYIASSLFDQPTEGFEERLPTNRGPSPSIARSMLHADALSQHSSRPYEMNQAPEPARSVTPKRNGFRAFLGRNLAGFRLPSETKDMAPPPLSNPTADRQRLKSPVRGRNRIDEIRPSSQDPRNQNRGPTRPPQSSSTPSNNLAHNSITPELSSSTQHRLLSLQLDVLEPSRRVCGYLIVNTSPLTIQHSKIPSSACREHIEVARQSIRSLNELITLKSAEMRKFALQANIIKMTSISKIIIVGPISGSSVMDLSLAFLSVGPKVTHIVLNSCSLNDYHAFALRTSLRAMNLVDLSMTDNAITYAGANALLKGLHDSSLQTLNLANNRIFLLPLQLTFGDFAALPKLRNLNLSGNRLTKDKALSFIRDFKDSNMDTMSISGIEVTKDGHGRIKSKRIT